MRAENSRLLQQLREMNMDLDDATNSRRQLQHHLQELEERMGYVSLDNDQMKNRDPYVLVLIDGNGLIFRQNFIQQGVEGGRRAAIELHNAVANEPLIHANGAKIFVKIIANMSGLNRALKRDGSVSSENEFHDFVAGFNRASFFDFVDVGNSKESTISKVKVYLLVIGPERKVD
ncbi:hypothetical protein ONZ43_g2859 [Nemania bipapillata]|uniref:Uncharacterized protein n=1 Tax=Nemania bipapillata TaxID=110536 RepID=A0ACC2IZC9_9PEZI|nr:hypothetical protein ONZ43_g2859 [Nemania bipapillata]